MTITVRRGGGTGSYQQTKALADQNAEIERLKFQQSVTAQEIAIISGDYLYTGSIGVTVQGYSSVLQAVLTAGQQAAVADASGGATVDTEARAQLNALLAKLRTLGLIAT